MVVSNEWSMSARPLTIEYAGQHSPAARHQTQGQILSCFQGIIKLSSLDQAPTNTGQHNPLMAAKGWASL